MSVPRPVGRFASAHLAALEGFALHLCGNGADARDLVQDTVEKALRFVARGGTVENERAWLFAILHNQFRQRCRQRSRAPHADLEDLDLPAPEPEPPPAWTRIDREQLDDAVEQLDPHHRDVYRLHALDNLSYQEIAARLGIPSNTVGSRLLRARRRLRELLAHLVPEPESCP
jgi:RNA polymerase sigma-70 factor, ECF subfamily